MIGALAKWVAQISALAAILAAATPLGAQDYPSRVIRLVVPYLPGGGTDILTRTFAREFERSIGQTVIIENRAGAGGLLGTQSVINSEPNGYTLLVGDNSTNSFVPALAKTPRYDPVKDLTPISLLLDVPYVLVVHPSVPAKSLSELIALAKAQPGFYNHSTAGVGSFSHVAMELLNAIAGIRIVAVAYKGGAEALPALVKGEVHIGLMPLRNALPYIENGQIRAIAVPSRRRALFLPNVPTMAETLKEYAAENWYGLYGPGNLPELVVAKLSIATGMALDSELMRKFASDGGTSIQKTSPAEFKAIAKEDYEKWAKIIDQAGIPKN
jgi:tripartite-type tricarboxylate transporter receptor subunit TctC